MILVRLFCFLFMCLTAKTGLGHELEIQVKVRQQPDNVFIFNECLSYDQNPAYYSAMEEIFISDLGFSGHIIPVKTKSAPYRYEVHIKINEKSLSSYVHDKLTGETFKTDGLSLSGEIRQDQQQIHLLADKIHRIVTGIPGISSSKILFMYTESSVSQQSEIRMTEYNGRCMTVVADDGILYICPKFLCLPYQKKGAYLFVSYQTGIPKIFLRNLNNGTTQKIISLKGNQLTPDISLHNDKIAFISDLRGNPDLFIQSFSPEKGPLGVPMQLLDAAFGTQGDPSFSPTGEHLAFVSNKEGEPKIYIIQLSPTLSNPHLLTKKYRGSNCPAWSPDGTKIAFCAITKGVRQIHVYDMLNREDFQVTFSSGNKESPSWAADSEHLVFSGLNGKIFDLYVINIVTSKITKITEGMGNKRFPSWEQNFKPSIKRVL